MALAPDAGGAQGDLALVAGGNLHARGFPHDAEPWPDRRRIQHVDQAAHAHTADLFIVRQRQMQRHLQRALCGLQHGGDGAGDKTLHVGRAPAVVAPVHLGQGKRRHRPNPVSYTHLDVYKRQVS